MFSFGCSTVQYNFIEHLFYYQSCGKIQKYRSKTYVREVAKTGIDMLHFLNCYSWLFYILTLKIYLFLIVRNPNKIKQKSKSHLSNPLSYPISSKPTKIKHFSHFTTQKSNSHLSKNPLTISKSSLFISTFTDKHFPVKNCKLYYLY